MTTSFKHIEFEVSGAIASLTFNRPEVGNAINLESARELARAAVVCAETPSIKVVTLTGRGKMFCAGGDIRYFATFGADRENALKAMADEFHRAVSTLARMPAILVVAVNGAAAGAGFSLAIAGDYVIAADNAPFTLAYTRAGLSPDGSSSFFLPRLVGLRRAQELMLSNRVLSAAEAHTLGVVSDVVPASELPARTRAFAERIAAGPGHAQAAVKRLLLTTYHHSLEEQMEIEGQHIARCSVAPDGEEGIRAFLEKRVPKFGSA